MLGFFQNLQKPRRMRIVTNGHPALRRVSRPIVHVTGDVRELADRMIVTMLENDVPGVGLAAPQVGINIRLIVLMTAQEGGGSRPGALPGEMMLESHMPLALVNPELVHVSAETVCESEGCLSLPGVGGMVTRAATVVLQARTLDGEEIVAECGGLLARCLQHEIDHLDGKLFFDRLSSVEQTKAASRMEQMVRREEKLAGR